MRRCVDAADKLTPGGGSVAHEKHNACSALPARSPELSSVSGCAVGLVNWRQVAQASSLPQVVTGHAPCPAAAGRTCGPHRRQPARATARHRELASRPALRIEPQRQRALAAHGGRRPALRGMDPRHVLVLVTARASAPVTAQRAPSDQLDWTGAMDIAGRGGAGPMSVLYGAEALGGVINVITQPLSGELEARALPRPAWPGRGRRPPPDRAARQLHAAVALRHQPGRWAPPVHAAIR